MLWSSSVSETVPIWNINHIFLHNNFHRSSKNDKSQPRGTFEPLGPIGGLVTELWSFLLSSDIDLPLRQLVWADPFPLLIPSPPLLQSKALRKYQRIAWSQKKPNYLTFLPLLWSPASYRGLECCQLLIKLNQPFLSPSYCTQGLLLPGLES